MKTLRLVCLFALGLCSSISHAQPDTNNVVNNAQQVDIADYLPPLQILLDSAVANSPEMAMLDASTRSQEYLNRQERKDWADLISASANYRLSRFNNVNFGNDEDPTVITPRDIDGYTLQAGIRVPLSFFIGRGDRLKAADAQLDAMAAQKEMQRRAVEELVIDTYEQLLLLQRLIQIQTEAKESSILIWEMSEERFRDGELTLDQLGSNTSLKANAASSYEQLRTEFSITYARLERLVGVPLSKLPK